MDSMHEGDDREGFRRQVRSADSETIRLIAETMRAEFGDSIDAHPGGVGSEAGVVNRAFLSAARAVLGCVGSTGDDPAAVLTWALRQMVPSRLEGLGVSGQQAEALLVMEPALGDRWLVYLALAPAAVVEDLLRGEAGG